MALSDLRAGGWAGIPRGPRPNTVVFFPFHLALAPRALVWHSHCLAEKNLFLPRACGAFRERVAGLAGPSEALTPGALSARAGGRSVGLVPWMGSRCLLSLPTVLFCAARGRRQLLAWEEQVT